MLRVDITELQRDVERIVALASIQPVAITTAGVDTAVMISVKEYNRLKRRDREVLGREDLTGADLEAIERAEAPSGAAAFDHELEK